MNKNTPYIARKTVGLLDKIARSEKQHSTLSVEAEDEKGFLPYGKEFHDFSFVDDVNGFLTSYSSVKDFGLYRTEDSGQTWKFQKLIFIL